MLINSLGEEDQVTFPDSTWDEIGSTRMFAEANEWLPLELTEKILLELCKVPSYYDPSYGKVLRGTLAACRLVCRRWSEIVKSTPGRFFILAYDNDWPSPSFSWYILRRPPLQLQNERGDNREVDPGWLLESYRTALVDSHPKFLPELLPNIIPGIHKSLNEEDNYKEEQQAIIQNTLVACCLVSRGWNAFFTPILYGDIFLGGKRTLLTRPLLHRTFRRTRPAHKALVKTVTIEPAEDGSTASLLSICSSFSLPNLSKLILKFEVFDLADLHPNFAQNVRFLSRCCTVQIGRGYNDRVRTNWKALSGWISFIRRSQSTPCSFEVSPSGGRYRTLFIFHNRLIQ